MARQSGGISEAGMGLAHTFAHRRPEIGANAIGAALIHRVARRAFLENFRTLGHVGRLHQQRNGRLCRRTAFSAALCACNFKAAGFHRMVLKNLARDDCCTQCNNACCQRPSSDGVELIAIAHAR